MSIKSLQNEKWSIIRIAAARRLYSISKNYNNFYILINVVLTSVLTLVSVLINSDTIAAFFGFQKVDLSNWLAVYSVIVLSVDKIVISDGIDSTKDLAAKIQEQFDRRIFGLGWNSVLAGDEPRAELVNRHGDWYLRREGDAGLVDWYSVKSNKLSVTQQALVCQSSCLCWDVQLRNIIDRVLIGGSLLILITALVLCVYLDLSFSSAIVNLVALAGPLAEYIHSSYKQNSDSISNAERLLGSISGALNEAKGGANDTRLFNLVDKIQDQIFIKRKSDWPIPDLLYRFFRSRQENDMKFSTKELEKELEALLP